MNVASFNVRGISSSLKKENLIKDLIKYKVDIMTIQETKIALSDETIDGHRLITFEHKNIQGGLGFLISKQLKDQVHSYWSVNERLAILKINSQKNLLSPNKPTIIVNIHLPTTVASAKDPAEREHIYNELEAIVRTHNKDNDIVIAGDFNSKIGKKIEGEKCSGNYSKGQRNDNGQRLIDFCNENQLFIVNTAFKHPSRHITTWEGAFKTKDNTTVKVFNQIDYIIIKEEHKKYLTDSRTFSGTNINTDHRLLIAKIRTEAEETRERNKYKYKQKSRTTTDFTSLQDKNIQMKFQHNLETKLQHLEKTNITKPNDQHENLIKSIIATREETLPKIPNSIKREHCPIIQRLSERQKQIRMNISSCQTEQAKKKWKSERNKILHKIKAQSLKNYITKIDNIAAEIQQAPDSMKMYKAVKNIKQNKRKKLVISDKDGKILGDDKEIIKVVKEFFEKKFGGKQEIDPFDPISPELDTPITQPEVNKAIQQLNNNRAAGLDTIKAEELKSLTLNQQKTIADMFNEMFTKKDHLDLGSGKLVLLNKPNKKRGPVENLRPIVLLSTLRKLLSIITLNRIRPKMEEYLSPSQSGFRQNRSTSDIVWAHRWLKGRTEKFKEEFSILGIDMSSAFDTICRTKLIRVLETFLEKDHIRLIRSLLANTSLTFSSGKETTTIKTTLGTPQGDSLSPILFTVYLEAALKELRTHLPNNERLTRELIYADDVDLIFDTRDEAQSYIPIISNTLNQWNLKVNEAKTEITTIERHKEEWKSVRKLGSLINENEDIKKRKILAQNAFHELKNIWNRRETIREQKRITLYEALIVPILLYNSGTWGLTGKSLESLDVIHRKHLRNIIGIHWPDKISNKELYDRCKVRTLSQRVKEQRWRLFGHILRRDDTIPAQSAMIEYFKDGPKFKGRTPTSLPTTLNQDLKHHKKRAEETTEGVTPADEPIIPATLKSIQDLHELRKLAQDRETWKRMTNSIQKF